MAEEQSNSGALMIKKSNYWYLTDDTELQILAMMKNQSPSEITTWGDKIRNYFEIYSMPNGCNKNRCKYLIDRVKSIANKHFSSVDDSTLVDQCVVLHAYKKFVMLTFGEPKELSYYVMLDKGFLEKKKLSKYEEYDSKLDANIKKEIEILHKQNLEKEQIKIEEKSTEMEKNHAVEVDLLTRTINQNLTEICDLETQAIQRNQEKQSLLQRREKIGLEKERREKEQKNKGSPNYNQRQQVPMPSNRQYQQSVSMSSNQQYQQYEMPPNSVYQHSSPPPYKYSQE